MRRFRRQNVTPGGYLFALLLGVGFIVVFIFIIPLFRP